MLLSKAEVMPAEPALVRIGKLHKCTDVLLRVASDSHQTEGEGESESDM